MQFLRFSDSETFKVALLVKYSNFKEAEVREAYVRPLVERGITIDTIMAASLPYNSQGKIPVGYAKEYLKEILPLLASAGVDTLYVADAAYFKALTKAKKSEPNLGYVLPTEFEGLKFNVILGINHHSITYNPNNESKLILSLDSLADFNKGKLVELGSDIIHYEYYPETLTEIRDTLNALKDRPELYADIEAFGLVKETAGIGTIAFAFNKHEGVAFCCDYEETPDGEFKAKQIENHAVREMLKEFFTAYKGTIYWHGANYDIGVIIRTLWMKSVDDYEGLLEGLEVMCPKNRWNDTRLIAVLALNSCSRNSYGLKDLAHSYAGNYAHEEIKDIRKADKKSLLKYNLIDTLCTAYVAETYHPIMVEENQNQLYPFFMEAQKTIIHMELVGMPVNINKVAGLRGELQTIIDKNDAIISSHPAYSEATYVHRCRKAEAANKKLKKLRKTSDDFADEVLNLNSGSQLAMLLYEVIGLPIIETTETGAPATGGDVLENLKEITNNQEVKDLLTAIIERAGAIKILSTFVPAFEKATPLNEHFAMLQGSFTLGGAVSGRMSSSKPNLQNLPSNSDYGKAVKKCFQAPRGWLFTGADFNSLEDYISALTTKDPNKLKVYSGLKQYRITVNGKTQIINEESEVKYDGELLTGEALYEKLQSR